MVTPDIHDIVEKSISVGRNLMFYLPRSIDIKELFDIIHDVVKQDIIFLDTYVLESANKIKAILLIYGIEPTISKLDMQNFISLMLNKESSSSVAKSRANSFSFQSPSYQDEPEMQDLTRITRRERKAVMHGEDPHEYVIEKAPAQLLCNLDKQNQSFESQLFKISLVIGAKKFFECILKFKEKNFSKDDGKSFNSHFGQVKAEELITYFCTEVLTSKQLSRIQ